MQIANWVLFIVWAVCILYVNYAHYRWNKDFSIWHEERMRRINAGEPDQPEFKSWKYDLLSRLSK